MNTQTPRKRRRAAGDVYVLSIKLPRTLVEMIDQQADEQARTTASLIRQVLLERFRQVA